MQSQGTYEITFTYFTVYIDGSLVLKSKSCSSLAEMNIYSSAKWHSLSTEDKEKYKSMAVNMGRNPERLINVKHEVTKLLNRLQELLSYLFTYVVYVYTITVCLLPSGYYLCIYMQL